jgi:uncharacterized protein (TIGR02270 family)
MVPVMMDIVEEHLDEATWLWAQWERALVAPDHDLSDTAALEKRLLAHVDGLIEGGVPVIEAVLNPALDSDEPTRVSAAALALLGAAPPSAEMVRRMLHNPNSVQGSAMQRALEVCEHEGLGKVLVPLLLRVEDPGLQATILKVLVFRDDAPTTVLTDLLARDEPQVQMTALRGLRPLPQTAPQILLSQSLSSTHPGIQAAAIEAGLTMGAREAWKACRQAVSTNNTPSRELLVLWAMGGDEEDVGVLVEMLRVPELRANALWALGFSGWLTAAEACLLWLGDAKVSKLAGEAFSAITGLHLEGKYRLPPETSPEEPIPLEQEDLDADLSSRPEDDLPTPHPEAVASWWHEERKRFTRGMRYLMGHPFQGEVLCAAFERGPMRRRHVWAQELAIRSQGACRIPTRAFTHRQLAALERAKMARERIPGSSFSRLFGR